LILQNLELAERVGRKYASRHKKHIDECVAEAYFQLCMFFQDTKLWDASKVPERTLACFIKRNIKDYFRDMNKAGWLGLSLDLETTIDDSPTTLAATIIDPQLDSEMLEYLSEVMADDNLAFEAFNYLKLGISLGDVSLMGLHLRKIASRIRFQVTGRLKRLKSLQDAGFPVTRKV
jgi:hypothetical protein